MWSLWTRWEGHGCIGLGLHQTGLSQVEVQSGGHSLNTLHKQGQSTAAADVCQLCKRKSDIPTVVKVFGEKMPNEC